MNYTKHKDNPKCSLTGLIQAQYFCFLPFLEAVHDKKMIDTCIPLLFPAPCIRMPDTGDTQTIIQPVKKSWGKELSEQQKNDNREASSIRVRVGYVIGSANFMRIVKDECRLRVNFFVEYIFTTCAALYNLRIEMRSWAYKN